MNIPKQLLVLLFIFASLQGFSQNNSQDSVWFRQNYYKIEKAIPMRDGITLATDIYLPPGDGPFPVIFMRTPYNKDGGAGIGQDGSSRGYAIVSQDTRGFW